MIPVTAQGLGDGDKAAESLLLIFFLNCRNPQAGFAQTFNPMLDSIGLIPLAELQLG